MKDIRVAGGRGGSVTDPKRPIARNADEKYSPEEDVNQGPAGGKKGKVMGGHGQGSDGSGEHDDLVSIAGNKQDPYRAVGSDWANGKTSAGVGTGQGSDAMGDQDNLVPWSGNKLSPRNVEDDGMGDKGAGTPVPGDRASMVAKNFSISTNEGEGNSDTGEVGINEYINLQTGRVCADGYNSSPVMEVPQNNVKTPGRQGKTSAAGLKSRD